MKLRVLIALVVCGYTMPAWAAEEAGQVLFVAGTVTVERATTIPLKKADSIYEKDVVVTAARSRGQLLMRDGAKFALRPETRFVVEEYFLAGDERTQPDGSVVVAAQDSAVTGLIKGGFRTITGAIGKGNADDYVVETPGATMGIRGTHYSVVWCAGDCEPPPGINDVKAIKDGLYIGVTDGIVVIRNLTGEYTLGAGEFVYVKDRNSRPVRLPDMPAVLIDTYPTDTIEANEAAQQILETIAALGDAPGKAFGSPGSRPTAPDPGQPGGATGTESDDSTGSVLQSASNDGSNGGFEAEPKTRILTSDGQDLTGGDPPRSMMPAMAPVAMAIGSLSGLSAVTAASNTGTRTFVGNDLTAFQAPPSGATDTIYAIGSAALRDDGFDPVTSLGWGRWTTGLASVTQPDGTPVSVDLGAQSLHWVYGPLPMASTMMPITGTANYTLIAGNTDPTDTMGNTGVLGSASLIADFTNAMVQSDLLLAIGGRNWEASGSAAITGNLFGAAYSTLLIDGQSVGADSGNFSGFFGAPGANGFPNGAGLTYGLNDGTVSVSGAVVFGPSR